MHVEAIGYQGHSLGKQNIEPNVFGFMFLQINAFL